MKVGKILCSMFLFAFFGHDRSQNTIELDGKRIIAVIDTTFAAVKRKPEKK